MDWSPSKLIRIENGDVRITPIDLRALLDHYGVHDPERVASLVDTARSSRDDSWAEFREVHTSPWLRFLAYESSASLIREYECLRVPGILATEEYQRAAYRASEVAEAIAEKRWEAHLRRQELHERANPPAMFFILDEAVLRRQMGGERVMRRQLERLRELSDYDHLRLQLVPFSAGGYRRLGGSFVYLEFPDANDDDVLHIEDPQGGVTLRDDVEATSRAVEDFLKLEDVSLDPDKSREMLDRLIAGDTVTSGSSTEAKEVNDPSKK
jgi:hypothetical protein